MMPEHGEFLEADTVEEVCSKVEEVLGELRAQGRIDLLPEAYRSISATTAIHIRNWCEKLALSEELKSGRLDGYFILFDTALARLEEIESTARTENRRYDVYSRQRDRNNKFAVRRQRFSSLDQAVSACIELVEHGHKIMKVRLPGGSCVMGSQVEWAVSIGRQTVKVTLRRSA